MLSPVMQFHDPPSYTFAMTILRRRRDAYKVIVEEKVKQGKKIADVSFSGDYGVVNSRVPPRKFALSKRFFYILCCCAIVAPPDDDDDATCQDREKNQTREREIRVTGLVDTIQKMANLLEVGKSVKVQTPIDKLREVASSADTQRQQHKLVDFSTDDVLLSSTTLARDGRVLCTLADVLSIAQDAEHAALIPGSDGDFVSPLIKKSRALKKPLRL